MQTNSDSSFNSIDYSEYKKAQWILCKRDCLCTTQNKQIYITVTCTDLFDMHCLILMRNSEAFNSFWLALFPKTT